jgi:hypothetical protein
MQDQHTGRRVNFKKAILIIQHCGARATGVSKSFYFEQNFKTCPVGE